jgi:heme/copper-type cytochrome/quinol oxidase subunit 3
MGVRLYKHRHGIHITVGNVMLDVIYVAVVDYGFKRTEITQIGGK